MLLNAVRGFCMALADSWFQVFEAEPLVLTWFLEDESINFLNDTTSERTIQSAKQPFIFSY